MRIRSLPVIATGFCQLLVVPGGPISSLCPLSLFPLSSSMSLSDDLSFCGHQGSSEGCRCHAKHMADQFPSLSLYLLCDWFCSCYSAQQQQQQQQQQQSLFLLLPNTGIYYKTILKMKLEYWLPGITIGTCGARQLVDISIK